MHQIWTSFLTVADRMRARIKRLSSRTETAPQQTNVYPFVAGALLAIALSIWLHGGYDYAIEGGDLGLETAVMMVVAAPFVILLAMLFSVLTGLDKVRSFIKSFSMFLQIGIMLFGGRILVDWYWNPEISRFEPLFTIIGVAIAGIQVGQYWIRSLEAALNANED